MIKTLEDALKRIDELGEENSLLRTELENLRSKRAAGRKKYNETWTASYNDFVVKYDVRKVIPNEYRLFQAADLICTLELLRVKTEHQDLTNSEKRIFHSKRDLKKDFLKEIKKKEFI